MLSRWAGTPRVVGRPAMSKPSFTVMGTPNSSQDLSGRLSSSLAGVRVRSKSRTTMAFSWGPGARYGRCSGPAVRDSRSCGRGPRPSPGALRAPSSPRGRREGGPIRLVVRYAMEELKAPPSISRLWPTMKPEEAAQRKAQASPNSAGSPIRPVGFSLARRASSSSTVRLLR